MSLGIRPVYWLLAVVAFVAGIGVMTGLLAIWMVEDGIFFLGLGTLLVAAWVAYRASRNRSRPRRLEPESTPSVPTPGDDLMATAQEFSPVTGRYMEDYQHIVLGLRGAATAVLTRFRGLTDEAAERALDEGTWTDDDWAASFLSREQTTPTSTGDRIWTRIGVTDPFQQGVERTATAIASVGYDADAPAGDDRDDGALDCDDGPLESVEQRTTRRRLPGPDELEPIETGHLRGIGALALVAIGLGALADSAPIVLAGIVGVGYAGVANALAVPRPDLSVTRVLDEESPGPDEEVTVTLTVTNEGSRPVLDLRIVDGVPASLAVTDGSPRAGTALRPGESIDIEYTVTATVGRHEFDPTLVCARDGLRTGERRLLLPSETVLSCEPRLQSTTAPVPLQPRQTALTGQLRTPTGGEGTEFHSVRAYRESDPLNRIDWNRRARTGELATLEFHEQRAARVLLVVDARRECFVSPGPGQPHAVSRSLDAVGRLAATLLAAGDTVGLAALGPTTRTHEDAGRDETADPVWVAPGSGRHHRAKLATTLSGHPQFSMVPPDAECDWLTQIRRIRRQLASETQIVFLSPLADRSSYHVVHRFETHGHPVTVVSPDPTAMDTAGHRLARVARSIRRFDLQRIGVPVVDWRADEPAEAALAQTELARGDRP